jgi:hypothetical protein
MAGPPIVGLPRFVEIVIKGNVAAAGSNTIKTAFVYHYRKSVAGVVVAKAAVHAAFVATTLPAAIAAVLNVRWTSTEITYRWLDDANDAPQSFTIAATGGIATDSLPTYNAIVVRLVSAQKGRSGRGSKHYGPGNESDTTGDVLTGARLTAWQAIRDLHILPFTDASVNTWVPCVVSRIQNYLPVGEYATNPTNVISYDVTSAILNTTLGTMRRRKVKTVA